MKLYKQHRHLDNQLLLIVIFLCLFGLIMIYEASNVVALRDFHDKYFFVKNQFIFFLAGSFSLLLMFKINYKKLCKASFFLFIISLFLLIAVFFPGIGIKTMGAKRWINLYWFTFQPAELIKATSILYLASLLTSKKKISFFTFLFLLALVIGLVIVQPDLGTAVIITIIFLVTYFLSGASMSHIFLLVPLVLLVLTIFSVSSAYRVRRLISYLNPNIDPQGASYHIRQILIALGSGGLFGVGLGASRQKYQYLPEAATDSIFAIIGEEFGFVGAFLIILLYLVLLYRILLIVKKAPDKLSYLIGGGILAFFGIQPLINFGSMVVLFPLTGIPLPFISYGGSNLIVSLVLIGLILNIGRQTVKKVNKS